MSSWTMVFVAVCLAVYPAATLQGQQSGRRIGLINGNGYVNYRFYDANGKYLGETQPSPKDALAFLQERKQELAAARQSVLAMGRQLGILQDRNNKVAESLAQQQNTLAELRAIAARHRSQASAQRSELGGLRGRSGFNISSSAGQAALAARLNRIAALESSIERLESAADSADQAARRGEESLRTQAQQYRELQALLADYARSYNQRASQTRQQETDLARALQNELNRQNRSGDHAR